MLVHAHCTCHFHRLRELQPASRLRSVDIWVISGCSGRLPFITHRPLFLQRRKPNIADFRLFLVFLENCTWSSCCGHCACKNNRRRWLSPCVGRFIRFYLFLLRLLVCGDGPSFVAGQVKAVNHGESKKVPCRSAPGFRPGLFGGQSKNLLAGGKCDLLLWLAMRKRKCAYSRSKRRCELHQWRKGGDWSSLLFSWPERHTEGAENYQVVGATELRSEKMATSFCQERKEAEEKEKLLLESHPNRLPVAFWSLLVSGAGAHWSPSSSPSPWEVPSSKERHREDAERIPVAPFISIRRRQIFFRLCVSYQRRHKSVKIHNGLPCDDLNFWPRNPSSFNCN